MPQENKTQQLPAQRFSDPFSALRNEMERLFDNFSVGGFPSFPAVFDRPSQNGMMMPNVDVRENGKEIVIEAELAGIDEKDIDVSIQDGVLTIKGEKKFEHEEEEDDYHTMERRYGSFRRSMRLPDTVDENQIDAKFDKGLLTVTLAKKPEAAGKQRKIKIASH